MSNDTAQCVLVSKTVCARRQAGGRERDETRKKWVVGVFKSNRITVHHSYTVLRPR